MAKKQSWLNMNGMRFIFDRGRYKEHQNVGSQSAKKPGYSYKSGMGIGQAFAMHNQEIADVNAEIEKMNRR